MDSKSLKELCMLLIYKIILKNLISTWTNNNIDGKNCISKPYLHSLSSVLNGINVFISGYSPRRANSETPHSLDFNVLPEPNLFGIATSTELDSNAAAAGAGAGLNLDLNHFGSLLHDDRNIPGPRQQEDQTEIVSQDGAPSTNALAHYRISNSLQLERPCVENASALPIVKNETQAVDRKITENAPEAAQTSLQSDIHVQQDILEDIYKPEMFEEEVRLNTFKFWPHHSPSPAQMAMAGFYYTWIDDIVFCFWCGISLREWEEGESPIHEHYQNSPGCIFIRQLLENSRNYPLALQPFSVEESWAVSSGNGVHSVPSTCFNFTNYDVVTSRARATQYRNAMQTESNERLPAIRSRTNLVENILESIVVRRLTEEGFSRARVAEAVNSLIAGNTNFEISYDLLKATLLSMRATRHQSHRRISGEEDNPEDHDEELTPL